MEFLQDLFVLIGRVLIAGVFLWSAYYKATHWQVSLAYMTSRHVPKPELLLPISIGLKVVGGLLVFFGWHAHIGALLLLINAIPSAYWHHSFWKMPHGPDHKLEKRLFMKEVAIIGGLFLVLALGAGHFGFGGG
jgi:putative oxidoreductase